MPFSPWSGSGGSGSATQPYQFQVTPLGAKYVTDAAMSSVSSTTTLACTTSTPFVSTDVGKTVLVEGAGASGGTLVTTIATFTDSGHVILAAAASTTVSAAGCVYGADDTANINAAVTAAVAYAQAHAQYAEVVFTAAIYMVAAATTKGGSTFGNSQIPLPVIATSANKVTLVFKGVREATGWNHWLQNYPQLNGTVLVSSATGTNDGTYGEASVLGGPTVAQGYGYSTNVWNNMLVTIDGVEILLPNNPTMCGFDFTGMGQANVISGSVMCFCSQSTTIPATSAWQFGLAMPGDNNNNNCNVHWYSVHGCNAGIQTSEHTTVVSMRAFNCIAGIAHGGGLLGHGNSTSHGAIIMYAAVEACQVVLSAGAGSYPSKITIHTLDFEVGSGSFAEFAIIYDPSSILLGTVGIQTVGVNNTYNTTTDIRGGTNLRIYDLGRQYGPVAAPAVPGSGSNLVNPFWRDATVYISGTMTGAVETGAPTFEASTGLSTAGAYRLGTGQSIILTYGTAPTWKWVLD